MSLLHPPVSSGVREGKIDTKKKKSTTKVGHLPDILVDMIHRFSIKHVTK